MNENVLTKCKQICRSVSIIYDHSIIYRKHRYLKLMSPGKKNKDLDKVSHKFYVLLQDLQGMNSFHQMPCPS